MLLFIFYRKFIILLQTISRTMLSIDYTNPGFAIPLIALICSIYLFYKLLATREVIIKEYPRIKLFHQGIILGLFIAIIGFILDIFNDIYIDGKPLINLSLEQMFLIYTLFAIIFVTSTTLWLSKYAEKYIDIPLVKARGMLLGDVNVSPGLYLFSSKSKAFNFFLNLIDKYPGIILARDSPIIIKEKHTLLKDIPIYWITKIEAPNSIHPSRLPFILHSLVEFMKKERKPKVILIDGIEYLVIENDFESVFKMLATLKDHALLTKSFIAVIIEKDAFSPQQIALLKKEFKMLEE